MVNVRREPACRHCGEVLGGPRGLGPPGNQRGHKRWQTPLHPTCTLQQTQQHCSYSGRDTCNDHLCRHLLRTLP
eukprot:6085343-Pyramimonas_sp.AAC.1